VRANLEHFVLDRMDASDRAVLDGAGRSDAAVMDQYVRITASGSTRMDRRAWINESDQADRAISTGQLNALLRLHIRPIDVVVYHGSV
jgi:hypothetical protein